MLEATSHNSASQPDGRLNNAEATEGSPPVETKPQAPVAPVRPKALSHHGDLRTDDYYWLNDRDDPEVLAYLAAENAYLEAHMAHTEALRAALVEEFRARIKQNDTTVPVRLKDYLYSARTESDKDYPIHVRRKVSDGDASQTDDSAAWEIVLDVNAAAEGQSFYRAAGLTVSHDQILLAFAEDTRGRNIYTIRFKNLTTGEMLPDTIHPATENVVWANDNRTVFYAKHDAETLRAYQVYRHVLGTDPATDALIFEENDPEFRVWISKSRSEAFLFIRTDQTEATEWHCLPADDPLGEWRVILAREPGHEYDVQHHGDHFYLRTNADGATNFRVVRMPIDRRSRDAWEEVIPHDQGVLIEHVAAFKGHLVLAERRGGLEAMRIHRWADGAEHRLDFGEPTYSLGFEENPEFGSRLLRYSFSSPKTPKMTIDYDVVSGERTVLKRDEVLGGFDGANYRTERLAANAGDGTTVPVSIVYRASGAALADRPLLVSGYGAYGISTDPSFNAFQISLLDRGFICAIAHVRGGQEMGRNWYDTGRKLNKLNTFTDFIDCTEALLASGFGDRTRVFAAGGSAGGLLMGAVANLRPDLYAGLVARVPFVDALTTMLDESLPLTTNEYDEWGNPNHPEFYDYIKSYSPYDNVQAIDYPAILATTGLHDSQVQYWEPAKWVAKLRATKTDANPLFLRTVMEAGHAGGSGRTRQYEEQALTYAFLLDRAGALEDERRG